MEDMKNRVLSLMELGYKIDGIVRELNIEKDYLADIIIELDDDDLIVLKDKNWELTQKGKDVLKEMKESLKSLKLDYVYGNISKEDFLKKKKEFENIIFKERSTQEDIKEEIKDKNINCKNCGKENKAGSKFCSRCGVSIVENIVESE